MLRFTELRAAAKLNLTLDITGRRADGYHELETVMQSVSLFDRVRLERLPEPGKIVFRCESRPSLEEEDNTACRAARLFLRETGAPCGIGIRLEKQIPLAAGLGGGSADAAAVLVGLNRLCGTGLGRGELEALGMHIGADVPFCIAGGTQLARGAGEELIPFAPMPHCFLVLAKGEEKPSTAEMYRRFDESGSPARPDTKRLGELFRAGDLPAAAGELRNAFSVLWQSERFRALGGAFRDWGSLGWSLSGSGPTVFGVFASQHQAETCAGALRELGAEAFLCTPCETGCEIVSEG